MPSSHATRQRARPLLLLIGLLVGGLIRVNSATQTGRADDPISASPLVVRVYYDDMSDIARLQAFDVWEYNNLAEQYVLVAVDSTGYRSLIDQGWRVSIDATAGAMLTRPAGRLRDFYGGYRSVDELYADMAALNAAAPGLTELIEYGQSHCLTRSGCTTPGGDSWAGFPLRVMRVTNEAVPGSSTVNVGTVARGEKPIFFLIAGIHSREITTPEIAMRLLDMLVEGYGTDADITWLVDHHEVWVTPIANPDGHWLVALGETEQYDKLPFFQRKNANNDSNDDGAIDCPVWPPASFEQYGVDLNRNHSFAWGPPGSSSQPCNPTYRGLAPASEPEVAALESLMRGLFLDQRGPAPNDSASRDTTGLFISLHSFSNLILWPWGNTEAPAPNRVDLKAIGDKFATYNGYTSCQPSLCLYPTNGAGDDWVYGELGVPAFTFEIGYEFMPVYAEIDSRQWPDNRPALLYAAKLARTPYLTVHGPDVMDVTVASVGNGQLLITATVSDADNGGDNIAAAHVSIDIPPWQENAFLLPLQATDGAFDEPVEAVTGMLPVAGLLPGRHMLFARGEDDAGNRGAISAAFFEVSGPLPTDYLYLPFLFAGE